jgi:hypothetical protein
MKIFDTEEGVKMRNGKGRRAYVRVMACALLAVSLVLASRTLSVAADRDRAQGIIDTARVTFKEFMADPNYSWLQNNLDKAEGVLIFPQIPKGGFILGGSGGTGVFLARDRKTGVNVSATIWRGRVNALPSCAPGQEGESGSISFPSPG